MKKFNPDYLEFDGRVFCFDLKQIDKLITIKPLKKNNGPETELKQTFNGENQIVLTEHYEKHARHPKEIDGAMYDVIRNFLDFIMDYSDDEEDYMGFAKTLEKTPLGYKIVFNTLIKEGIIKEIEL